MPKSQAQIIANRKYNKTTMKEKFVNVLILRDIHTQLKNISLQTGETMQKIIENALRLYEVNSNDK